MSDAAIDQRLANIEQLLGRLLEQLVGAPALPADPMSIHDQALMLVRQGKRQESLDLLRNYNKSMRRKAA